jgi:hypothetical protein
VWPQAQHMAEAHEWSDEISGARSGAGPRWPVADLLRDFPVAALHGRIEGAA